MLFQFEVNGDVPGWRERFLALHPAAPEVSEYGIRIVVGVLGSRERLDAMIQAHTANWTLDRMARVDRNILRIAAFEALNQPEIPLPVALNEAIEVAKRFGDEKSSAFVNGVLDHMMRTEPALEPRRHEIHPSPAVTAAAAPHPPESEGE